MRLTWASLALALVLVTGHEGDGEYAEDLCKDRNDRWSAYGTSCDRVKAMCEDDFYGDLVRSWCPVTCGSCQAHRSFPFQVQSNAILRRSANHEDNATGDNASNATEATKTCGSATCGGATGEGLEGLPDRGSEPAEFIETKELEKKTESAGFNRSMGSPMLANFSGTWTANHSNQYAESLLLVESERSTTLHRKPDPPEADQPDLSAGKAILLLEELEEAAVHSVRGPAGLLDSVGKNALGALSSTLDALSLNFVNLTQDLGNVSEELQEPKAGKGAVAQILDFLLPDADEAEKEEKPCPQGWERVMGDVYGGDQFSGGWRHSAASVEDCAWKCLTQPGCGSFEWSEARKRCFRNSQTRPTHEVEREGFVFCRRQPCPSFKTQEACVGPGVAAGFYSKEVHMRPGSYCIWSSGACQAPMACTDSDCFLPDGGLPGLALPSRYTLWISRRGLQATML